MPLRVPELSDRTDELLAEALARIPVHTPEWTARDEGDPGVTLLELFEFLSENLTYRSTTIPERNRVLYLGVGGLAVAGGLRLIDRAFSLDRGDDRGRAELRFGDGIRGRRPPAGPRPRPAGYRYGGGAAGPVVLGAGLVLGGLWLVSLALCPRRATARRAPADARRCVAS